MACHFTFNYQFSTVIFYSNDSNAPNDANDSNAPNDALVQNFLVQNDFLTKRPV